MSGNNGWAKPGPNPDTMRPFAPSDRVVAINTDLSATVYSVME